MIEYYSDASIDGSKNVEKNEIYDETKDGKLAFTIWTTAMTTTTATILYTDTRTTFSVSYICTNNGETLPGAFCT